MADTPDPPQDWENLQFGATEESFQELLSDLGEPLEHTVNPPQDNIVEPPPIPIEDNNNHVLVPIDPDDRSFSIVLENGETVFFSLNELLKALEQQDQPGQ